MGRKYKKEIGINEKGYGKYDENEIVVYEIVKEKDYGNTIKIKRKTKEKNGKSRIRINERGIGDYENAIVNNLKTNEYDDNTVVINERIFRYSDEINDRTKGNYYVNTIEID